MSVDQFLSSATTTDLNYPKIRPSLNLNFAKTKSLDPRITFTRSSGGSYVGADGRLRYAGVNEPRFEHNPSTGESLGLLIEESRTNLITYSEQLDNAAWSKSNIGTATNTTATTAPDGSNNAEKLVENTSNAQHFAYQSRTASNETVTFSVFAKAAERTQVLLQLSNFVNAAAQAIYDLSTGIAGAPTVSNADYSNNSSSIIAYPNGWYRCILTTTKGSVNTTNTPAISTVNSGTASYTGDGTSGIYIWGAQLEARAFPTSYIPTVASTVTRSGDLAFIDLPSTGWYNYSQGSLIFQHSTVPYATGTSPGYPAIGFAQTSGHSPNAIQYFFVKDTGASQYLVRNAFVDQANISVSSPTGAPAAKVGFAYATNSFVLARNGSQVGTDTSGTVPQSIGTLLLGTNEKLVANNLNASISNVIYYPRALSSSQLQNLTK